MSRFERRSVYVASRHEEEACAPSGMDMNSVALEREAQERAVVIAEMLYSREERARRMAEWKRNVEKAKLDGYTRMPYDPPLVFPEPLAGMRRHPATGHLMADQPRNQGF